MGLATIRCKFLLEILLYGHISLKIQVPGVICVVLEGSDLAQMKTNGEKILRIAGYLFKWEKCAQNATFSSF